MRQKFWKELKSRLCPRENWVRDSDSPRCQCCGKEFSFFRRRHHCRFCGKLFCGHCCELFINGTYLGLSEKYVRHCEFCKEEIEKLKKDLNRLTYMVQEEEDFARSEDDDEDASSSDEDDEYFSVRVIFGSQEREGEARLAEELEQETRALGRRMLGRLVELGSVASEFQAGRLLEMLLRAVVETRMNILPFDLNSRSSYMDIARQVSIRTLAGAPGEHLELVRGVVLEKSLPVKHMLSRLVRPQVIVIENSLDESGVKVRFEDLINNEDAIYEQLEERIMKFNPDIVLVEHTTSRQLLNFFAEKGIAVISGLKKKDLQRIVQVAGVRNTIKNIWAIDRYRPAQLMGALDLMYIRAFEHNHDPFIYFERNIGVYSLLVSERTHDAQAALKRALQALLRLLRQANLEKYLIYLDFEMWEERDSRNAPRLLRISSRYLDSLERMRCEEVETYRVRLSEIKLEKEDKKLREYCKARGRRQFLDACGEGVHEAIAPYSEHDNTIGHFLLIMATGLVRRCSECRLEHRERYYFGRCGVEVSVRKVKEEGAREIHDEEDLSIEQMHKYLKKYKENWNIFSYFECRACAARLSKQVKVGKNYLKNSFYYFLYLVAHSADLPPEALENKKSQKTLSSQNSLPSLPSQNALRDCAHSCVERVLETSDIRFGMEVFAVERFQIRLIDLKAEEYLGIYRESLRRYIAELMSAQVEQKFQLQETLANIVDSYICLLEPFRFQEGADSRLIIELEKLESIRDILERLRGHLEELWGREKGKEYSHASDWTYFLREAAKVDALLKTTVDILRVVEGTLHKRKRKIEENEMVSVYTSDDNDSLLELDAREPPRVSGRYREERISREERTSREELEEFDLQRVASRENLEEAVALQREKSSEEGRQLERSDKYSLKSLGRKVSQSVLTFGLVYNQPRLRAYSEEMRRRRYQLKKGQTLYFNLVNYKKTISVLVCALNSTDFREQFEKRPADAFKFNLILAKDIPTSWDLKQRIDKIRGETLEDDADPRDSYEITAYYHREFQSLRETEGISFEAYIKSLANSEFWETMGGKSNSQFAKSQDELLVIKSIKAEEFDEFLKFAPDYLRHVQTINPESFLTKVYGIYEVVVKGDSYRLVVMQNLFLGFEGLPLRKYDLKGSEVNRLFLAKTPEQASTGLDTNFKVDKNYHPYFIKEKSYRRFLGALEEDVHFLCKNEVIDYSLLVIEHGRQLRMGIIDFMRPYHLMERIENKYKELTNKNEPTVIPPQEYANRFLLAMRNYFAYYD